ncbi:MAG TPA: MFS transporter [Polyangiaceae bacterium]|nr:MFS transporter [Polyangiaceae bacterium]
MSPLSLLFVALFNSILGLSVLFPILGPLGRQLGLTELQIGALTTAYALAQFAGSPFWGKRSEVVGRKPVLLRGILGFALTFAAFGVIARLGQLGVLRGNGLFAALLVSRLMGGLYSSATLPTVQAYVADVTERDHRTSGMALIGAAFGLAVVFGPAIGALLAPFGLLVPVFVSASIALLNALFVAWKLPEPVRHERSPVAPELLPVASKVWVLLGVGFVATVAAVSMEQTVAFYFQDRLALNETQAARNVGFSLVAYGVVAVLVQGVFVRRAKWPPLRLLRLGLPIAAFGLFTFVLARGLPLLLLAMVLQGLGQAMTSPGVTAALSLGVQDEEQGAVAGLNSASQALGRTLGPVLGTALYEIRPEYPYLFGCALLVVMSLLLFGGHIQRSRAAAPR